MKGKWDGEYWFIDKAPDILLNRKTKFELYIDSIENSKLTGWVKDDLETGGTRGKGSMSGKIKGNRIRFIKQMPIKTYVNGDGKKTEEEKPHRPIYYQGTINYKTNEIEGSWRFKKGFGFIKGKIAFYLETKGEWKMKKVV
jgi:hypothetical protein